MPKSEKFLSGFNIHKGLNIDNYTLTNIEIDHVEIKKFNEYLYPMELTFKNNDNHLVDLECTKELIFKFQDYIKNHKIIYSESAHPRPYKCTITFNECLHTDDDNFNEIIIKCTGFGKRIKKSEIN